MLRIGLVICLLLTGCEIFPVAVDPNILPQKEQTPVFDFTYVNSETFQGYIRFENHCVGIKKYNWSLGVLDENGKELMSNSPAPKVKYPRNGTYRVIVEGYDAADKHYEQTLQVEVTTY